MAAWGILFALRSWAKAVGLTIIESPVVPVEHNGVSVVVVRTVVVVVDTLRSISTVSFIRRENVRRIN